MILKKPKYNSTLKFFSVFLMLITNAYAVPGDFDADGASDLSVALVNKSAGSTAWLTRLNNGTNPFAWTFGLPADAFVTGRFFAGNARYYPGIVYVRSASFPLEWYIKNAANTDVLVKYGVPGDTITNLGDWDGDGVDDLHVVRKRSDNFLVWYVALSKTARIAEYVFGVNGDQVGVTDYDGDGIIEMVALRSGFQWFVKKPSENSIINVQWGLTGDIPLSPTDFDGDKLVDFIISRRTGGVQTAFIRFGNGQTTTRTLGLATSIPQIGDFGGGRRFAWSQRDSGLTAISNLSGTEADVFKFGISTNFIIAPDGTVTGPTNDGRFGVTQTVVPGTDPTPTPDPGTEPGDSSGAGCAQVIDVRSNAFIYKQSAPLRSGGVGTTLVGFRKEPTLIMNNNISNRGTIPVLDTNGGVLTRCPWASAHGHSGGRARCTIQTADMRRKAVANTGSPTVLFKVNANQCVSVPDAGRCYGSSKGLCDRLIQ